MICDDLTQGPVHSPSSWIVKHTESSGYNPGQDIWSGVRKPREIRQAWKTLISVLYKFSCYCQSLISGRETVHWARSPPKSETFLTFHNFLKPYVLSPSATCASDFP